MNRTLVGQCKILQASKRICRHLLNFVGLVEVFVGQQTNQDKKEARKHAYLYKGVVDSMKLCYSVQVPLEKQGIT